MAGEYAVFRHSTGGTNYDSTSWTDVVYETAVYTDGSVTANGSNDEWTLGIAGHWLVLYDLALETTTGSNRSQRGTRLTVDGVAEDLHGTSSSYLRRASGHNFAHPSSATILNVVEDASVGVEVARQDTNAATLETSRDASGIQFLKLDDNWAYYRAERTATLALLSDELAVGDVNSQDYDAWVKLSFTTDSEKDTGYQHSTSTSAEEITLDEAGVYLVTYNVHFVGTMGTRANGLTKLTVDDVDVRGSFSTAYARGTGVQVTNTPVAAHAMLVRTTSANQVLSLETTLDSSSATDNLSVTGQSITVVRLPDDGAVSRHRASIGEDHDVLDGTRSPVDLGTRDELGNLMAEDDSDTLSTGRTGTGNPFLMLGFWYQSYTAAIDGRKSPEIRFYTDEAEVLYGGCYAYLRGNNGGFASQAAASSGGALVEVGLDSTFELGGIDRSGASAPTEWRADDCGLHILDLTILFSGHAAAVATATPAVTASALGTVVGVVSGTVAAATSAVVSSAAGALTFSGNAAATLASTTAQALGGAVTNVSGAVASSVASLSATLSGGLGFLGAVVVSLAPVTAIGSGANTAPLVSGTVAASLAPVAGQVVGGLGFSGSVSTAVAPVQAVASQTPLDSWAFFRDITHDGSSIDSVITGLAVPVLIDGAAGDSIASNARADGLDIVFTDSTGAIIPFEIAHWDDVGGVLEAWVLPPTFSRVGATSIRVYYGRATNTVDYSDRALLWADEQVVLHMGADPSGTTVDSTTLGNDFISNGEMLSTDGLVGQVGYSAHFDDRGLNEGLVLPNASQDFDFGDADDDLEIHFWMRSDATGSNNIHRLVCWEEAAAGGFTGFNVYYNIAGALRFYCRGDTTATGPNMKTAGTVDTDEGFWHQVIVQKIGANVANWLFYVDGVEDSTGNTGTVTGAMVSTAEMVIGNQSEFAGPSYSYDGEIDEVRISMSVKTADEITASYAAELDNATFWSVGSQQGDHEGSVATSTGPVTASASGSLSFSGSASVSLTPVVATASGAVEVSVSGSVSSETAAVLAQAVGGLVFSGTASATLAPPSGTVLGSLDISGVVSAELAPVAAQAAGALTFSGNATATIAPVTGTAVVGVLLGGTASATFSAVTATATGGVSVGASVASILGPVTASASGSVTHTGSVTAQVPSTAGLAVGSLAFSGTVDAAVGSITAVVLGGQGITGTVSAQVPAVSSASMAELEITGTATATLGPVLVSTVGSVANPVTGTISASVAPVAAQVSGAGVTSGGVSTATAGVTASAVGTVLDNPTGSVVATTAAVTAQAVGGLEFSGTATVELGPVTATAAGTQATSGIVVASTVAPMAQAVGALEFSGAASASIPPPLGLATGSVANPVSGVVAADLAPVTASVVGLLSTPGATQATLAAVTGQAVGSLLFTGTVTATIAPVLATASGSLGFSGSIAADLPTTVGTATGGLGFSGVISSGPPAVLAAVVGGLEINGAVSASTAPVTSTVIGEVDGSSVSATLPAVQAAVVGSVAYSGSVTATLAAVTGVASADSAVTGSIASTLMPTTCIAAATLQFSGFAAVVLAPVSGAADGSSMLFIDGAVDTATPSVVSLVSGSLSFSGTVTAGLAPVIVFATGIPKITRCLSIEGGWYDRTPLSAGWGPSRLKEGGYRDIILLPGGTSSC